MENSISGQRFIAAGDVENLPALKHPTGSGGRPTPVIVDSGTWAEVVVLPATIPVGRGTRFRHRNAIWVVVGQRPGSGVFVAEPAEH